MKQLDKAMKYSTAITNYFCILFVALLILSCSQKITSISSKDDGKIEIAIVQINDVYEIAGVNRGTQGNLARVSQYYKDISKTYPNSLLVIAGDFLNPSLISTMKHNGERIRGKQMIETLNAMNLDLAAFGNHEFDLGMDVLQKRLNESNFNWIATNIGQRCGNLVYPFYKMVDGKMSFFPQTINREFIDADGTTASLGIFSATINSNPRDFIEYFNADSCAQVGIEELEKSDILIGLTHLTIDQDIALAEKHQGVSLIMGGHEHDHMLHEIGNVRITKADANAKTLYLHVISLNKTTDEVTINSTLVDVDESIHKDPDVEAVINKWNTILEENISTVVEEPYKIIYNAKTPLDARESTIRNKQSNMGTLITSAMLAASQNDAVAAFVNSGSVRLDDQLSGEITGVDIFRVLPFGGSIVDIEIKGNLLKGVLEYSKKHAGSGAFLQLSQISFTNDVWKIAGSPIKDDQIYKVITSDFLMKGYDIPFLKSDNPAVIRVDTPTNSDDIRYDIRAAIIDFLSN